MTLLTKDIVEQRIKEIEQYLQIPGKATAIGWMGIWLSWEIRPKKDGGWLRRGNSYGVIEYSDGDSGKQYTREEAIAEILTPMQWRQAKEDVRNITICPLCPSVAMGRKEREGWAYVHWKGLSIYLCPKCMGAITSGKLKRS